MQASPPPRPHPATRCLNRQRQTPPDSRRLSRLRVDPNLTCVFFYILQASSVSRARLYIYLFIYKYIYKYIYIYIINRRRPIPPNSHRLSRLRVNPNLTCFSVYILQAPS